MRYLLILFCSFFLISYLISHISPVHAQTPAFSLLWQYNGGSWAEHPILKDGIAYIPWTGGKLTAIELTTGKVLHSASGIASATAPFITGNSIYSFTHGTMTELNLDTFSPIRSFSIPSGFYVENIPFDAETGYFFARQASETDWKGRLTAFRVSDWGSVWSYPASNTGGFSDHQSPLVVGDSVYLQSTNINWSGAGAFIRLNKKTGQVIWSTTLGSPSRYGYNNPIYDVEHDIFYVTESYNSLTSTVYAIRRSNGAIAWKKNIPGYAIESTISYHNDMIYLPLHNFSGTGSYMAISATDGSQIWHEPGFFGEDGWSATGVDDKYLYRITHGTGSRIIVQDRLTGALVWSYTINSVAPCFNPILSNGIVLLGSETSVYALKVSTGQAVDSDFHGLNAAGYNPGAINWGSSPPTPTPIQTAGDYNRDGDVDYADLTLLLSAFGQTNSSYNLTGSTRIDIFDFHQISSIF